MEQLAYHKWWNGSREKNQKWALRLLLVVGNIAGLIQAATQNNLLRMCSTLCWCIRFYHLNTFKLSGCGNNASGYFLFDQAPGGILL